MKWLCVCEGGNVRSVAMAKELKQRYHQDALAVGIRKNDQANVAMLCAWADVIVLMQPEFGYKLIRSMRRKVRVVDVGVDRYHTATHPELVAQVSAAAKQWDQEGTFT